MHPDGKKITKEGDTIFLLIQCVAFCLLFTLIILPVQYRDPMKMIMSYPPEVIHRVQQLSQYQNTFAQRKNAHISKKILGLAFFVIIFSLLACLSGCKTFSSAFRHVFVIFFAVNMYDLLVLDWGIFCHSKKLRIPGTEDMDKAYTDYLFHVKGALIGTALGAVVACLSGIAVHFLCTV